MQKLHESKICRQNSNIIYTDAIIIVVVCFIRKKKFKTIRKFCYYYSWRLERDGEGESEILAKSGFKPNNCRALGSLAGFGQSIISCF